MNSSSSRNFTFVLIVALLSVASFSFVHGTTACDEVGKPSVTVQAPTEFEISGAEQDFQFVISESGMSCDGVLNMTITMQKVPGGVLSVTNKSWTTDQKSDIVSFHVNFGLYDFKVNENVSFTFKINYVNGASPGGVANETVLLSFRWIGGSGSSSGGELDDSVYIGIVVLILLVSITVVTLYLFVRWKRIKQRELQLRTACYSRGDLFWYAPECAKYREGATRQQQQPYGPAYGSQYRPPGY